MFRRKTPEVVEDTSSSSSEEEEEEEAQVPLLHYRRLAQTNNSSSNCCSALGKVVLTEETCDTPEWFQQTLCLLAVGSADGAIRLYESNRLFETLWIRSSSNKEAAIVGISWDATGTVLGAIDAAGLCAIWELKYKVATVEATGNALTSFVAAAFAPSTTTTTQPPVLQLAGTPQVHRLSYPAAYSTPTCLVLDTKRRWLVGFADGRVVLTKRGFVFQRRSDVVLHQGSSVLSMAWRGSWIAWADATGIRVMETETWTKVAHVERPKGALASSRPSLVWEHCDQLLVAWGDCLMALKVLQDATERRRKVECTMAWELDCVALGVAPLDRTHALVLGLMGHEPPYEVELQVVSRETGQILQSDLVPLVDPPTPKRNRLRLGGKKEAGPSYFTLLSSFAVPRMDTVAESADDEGRGMDPLQSALFPSAAASPKSSVDPQDVWDLSHVDFGSIAPRKELTPFETDDSSVDSDDYDFYRELSNEAPTEQTLAVSPVLYLVSSNDLVLSRVRSIDDAIAQAKSLALHATALRLGLAHIRKLRKYKLEDLVNDYMSALLRPQHDAEARPLSLRRMKLAAEAMPMLIGGNTEQWNRWVDELESMPGALFVVRSHLPVRDPILPKEVYQKVLSVMFEQLRDIGSVEDDDTSRKLAIEAEGHFLNTLLSWGTTSVLKEHVKYHEFQSSLDPSSASLLVGMEHALTRRQSQTAAVYLSFDSLVHAEDSAESASPLAKLIPRDDDSLYDVECLQEVVSSDESAGVGRRVSLHSQAVLSMMKGEYEAALRSFLDLGEAFGPWSYDEVDELAVASISRRGGKPRRTVSRYAFVLELIDSQSMQRYLLDSDFHNESQGPLRCLARLAGLDAVGDFLMKHCVAPMAGNRSDSSAEPIAGSEKRATTLPLDLIADQLSDHPKMLLWYLDLLFVTRPELYVRFPNTAHPPDSITALHRKALDLYIRFAGPNRDSAAVLTGVEAFRVNDVSTPLLSFLQELLPLGGTSPEEVANMLSKEIPPGVPVSSVFALERAHLLDLNSSQTEEISKQILELYLLGARSLMLSVSYAQRTTSYSSVLWARLIDFCLSATEESETVRSDGSLFGSLLEAAALSGADLAKLVQQIPMGMGIEGLRPRLVAAVADYRMKLQLHQSSASIADTEKKDLLLELNHRLRRGMLFMPDRTNEKWNRVGSETTEVEAMPLDNGHRLRRTRDRHRYRLTYTMALR